MSPKENICAMLEGSANNEEQLMGSVAPNLSALKWGAKDEPGFKDGERWQHSRGAHRHCRGQAGQR